MGGAALLQRHLHVKVKGPTTSLLTMQLYFPGEAGNARDYIFNPILVMKVNKTPDIMHAQYTFVLKA